MRYKLQNEKGMAVLMMAIITGIVVFSIGGSVLMMTRYMSIQSFQQQRQFNSYVVAESGLNDALNQLKKNQLAGKTGEDLISCASSTCTYESPKQVRLGNSCYNFWFGAIKQNNTPTITSDDYVTVHILAASPYQEPGGTVEGECTINQVANRSGASSSPDGQVNRQRDSKIIAIYADISLAGTGATVPRVIKVHWGQNLGAL